MITAREVERLRADLDCLRRDATMFAELTALGEELYRRLVERAAQATARLAQLGPEARQALRSELDAARDAMGKATAAALLVQMQQRIDDSHVAREREGWAGA